MKEDLVLIEVFSFIKIKVIKTYECKMGSFDFNTNKISKWKSTGIFNRSSNSNMNAVGDSSGNLPNLKNDGRMNVYLIGNHFQQNNELFPIITMLLIFIAFIN